MAIDPLYDTNVLVAVVRSLKVPSQFLLDTFFPRAVEFETEFVSFDIDPGLRRMAPFVSPLVEGKPVEGRKYQTTTFRPAYIKDRRTPDLRRPVLRAIGERIGGSLSTAERMMQNLAFELEDQVQMIDRRLEWMAAQALVNGSVTISGDGYEAVSVNFGRDPALQIDISSTGTNAPWLTATAVAALGTAGAVTYTTPSNSIETWSRLILQKSGRAPDRVLFTTGSFNLFVLDTRVQQSVWYQRSGDSRVNYGGTKPVQGASYKGNWGEYELWVYNDWYVDQVNNVSWGSGAGTITIPAGSTMTNGSTLATTDSKGNANGIAAGTTVTVSGTTATLSANTTAAASNVNLSYEAPMVPDNYVIMGSAMVEGARCFGAIMDPNFNYGALAYAPKSWITEDPPVRHMMMQSSPIVVPTRPNASLAAKVA